MDQLIKRAHQQLKRIEEQLYDTLVAREVDLYTPETLNNIAVYMDEDDFEEADVTGTLKTERLPLSYIYQNKIKVIEIGQPVDGRLSVVRNSESNEFDVNRKYHFISQAADLPLQSVIQFETLTVPDGSATQTIRLIKVDEQAKGRQPFVNRVHHFTAFHGVIN